MKLTSDEGKMLVFTAASVFALAVIVIFLANHVNLTLQNGGLKTLVSEIWNGNPNKTPAK